MAGRVGRSHEDSIEPFVVRTDPEGLSSRPRRLAGLSLGESLLRIARGEVHHGGFDVGQDPLEEEPIGRPQAVEGTTPD